MKRRIFLMLGVLLLLLAAFGVYHYLTVREAGFSGVEGEEVERPELTVQPREDRRLDVRRVGGPRIEDRDEYGRLRGLYTAREWDKRPDGSYFLEGVRVEIRHRRGERTHIRADEGVVFAEEYARGFNVTQATLSGDVRVFFDRATDPLRTPMTTRPDDVVRIYADRVHFDNDLLMIRAEGEFQLFSNEADMFGRGLAINWNEAPQELRLLRVEEGRYLCIYDAPLDVTPLPGADQAGGASAPRASEAAPTTAPGAATAPGPPTTQVAGAPVEAATRPAPATAPIGRPAAPSAALATTGPATRPASDKAGEPRNVYEIAFLGSEERVTVLSGPSRMEGARRLTLRVEWDRRWLSGEDEEEEQQTGVTSPVAGAGATSPLPGAPPGDRRPVVRPEPPVNVPEVRTVAPPTEPPIPEDFGDMPSGQPSTQPRKLGRGGQEPTVLTWRGPLTIEPIGWMPEPSRDRYTVAAEGERLVLRDGDARALCRSFTYESPTQRGRIEGSPDAPVWMTLEGGEQMLCRSVTFERSRGEAHLRGPGWLARGEQMGPATTSPVLRWADRLDAPPADAAESITWSESVEARFGTRSAADSDGRPATREVLESASFRGDVVLRDAETGNFLRSDRLDVEMASASDGSSYPRKAVATGGAVARQTTGDIFSNEQGAAEIAADRMTVFFEEVPAGEDDRREGERNVRETRLIAEGGVEVVDRREGEILRVTGERVDSDLQAGTATLTGAPAVIARSELGSDAPADRIIGPRILLDEGRQAMVVPEPGRLHLQTRQDLSGRQLDEPRPVTVSWEGRMEYQGRRSMAIFETDVRLEIGEESVACGRLQLLFAEPDEAPDEVPGQAESPRGRMALDMESYSGRDLAMVLATENVRLSSAARTPDGRLERRLQLTGPQVQYDPATKRMTVVGAGRLGVEDYRAPEDGSDPSPRDGVGFGGGIERPSQTAFEWQESMQLTQGERIVSMEGDVVMVHRSGRQTLFGEDLGLGAPEELPPGRRIALRCDSLLARFDEPDAQAQETDAGPTLGSLELLTATGDVNLREGVDQIRQVIGQRLVYGKREEGGGRAGDRVALIWGYLTGQAEADATLVVEDRQAGTSQVWQSPTIRAVFVNDELFRVQTGRLGGTGGR